MLVIPEQEDTRFKVELTWLGRHVVATPSIYNSAHTNTLYTQTLPHSLIIRHLKCIIVCSYYCFTVSVVKCCMGLCVCRTHNALEVTD